MTDTIRLGLLDLLDQDDVWCERRDDGLLVERRLDDMTDEHRAAALRLVRRCAGILHKAALRDLHAAWKLAGIGREAIEDEIGQLTAQHPARWLEDQPLVVRLARLAPRPPALLPGRRRGGGRCG